MKNTQKLPINLNEIVNFIDSDFIILAIKSKFELKFLKNYVLDKFDAIVQ